MNEERLKEIEARDAVAMPNGSAYESCHKDIPDLVAALRSARERASLLEQTARDVLVWYSDTHGIDPDEWSVELFDRMEELRRVVQEEEQDQEATE